MNVPSRLRSKGSERIDGPGAHPCASDDHSDTERQTPKPDESEFLRGFPLLGKERFAKGLGTSQQGCQGGDDPQLDQERNQDPPGWRQRFPLP